MGIWERLDGVCSAGEIRRNGGRSGRVEAVEYDVMRGNGQGIKRETTRITTLK
jgi:hypothetical protein